VNITLPWWHRALRPWFDFLAARRASRALNEFRRVGYFLEVDKLSRTVIGVVEALENGRGKRKLRRLQGYDMRWAIPQAWLNGDDSVRDYLHPQPFNTNVQQVPR